MRPPGCRAAEPQTSLEPSAKLVLICKRSVITSGTPGSNADASFKVTGFDECGCSTKSSPLDLLPHKSFPQQGPQTVGCDTRSRYSNEASKERCSGSVFTGAVDRSCVGRVKPPQFHEEWS